MNSARLLTFLSIITFILTFEKTSLSAQTLSYSFHYSINTTAGGVYSDDDVDVLPQFPGGESARINFINATRRYPAIDYENRIQGRVVCQFVVNTDGSISDVSILRGVNQSLNAEAIRIISSMPKWEAGQINGENVPVMQVMSISFRL